MKVKELKLYIIYKSKVNFKLSDLKIFYLCRKQFLNYIIYKEKNNLDFTIRFWDLQSKSQKHFEL